MRKLFLRAILTMNIVVWIILSFINYIGIVQQLNDKPVKLFIWSIFIITMYGIIIYSLTLKINRILLIFHYRTYRIRYLSNKAFMKQNILLGTAVLYMYGICYINVIFLGLLPLLLFFCNILPNMGRFYVYINNEGLIMAEDLSKKYRVKDFNPEEKKLSLQSVNSTSSDTVEAVYKMDEEEIKFLSNIFIKGFDKVEVA